MCESMGKIFNCIKFRVANCENGKRRKMRSNVWESTFRQVINSLKNVRVDKNNMSLGFNVEPVTDAEDDSYILF